MGEEGTEGGKWPRVGRSLPIYDRRQLPRPTFLQLSLTARSVVVVYVRTRTYRDRRRSLAIQQKKRN